MLLRMTVLRLSLLFSSLYLGWIAVLLTSTKVGQMTLVCDFAIHFAVLSIEAT